MGEKKGGLSERISDSFITSIIEATNISKDLGHLYCGTDHLLYGVVSNKACKFSKVLKENKLNVSSIFRELKKRNIPQGNRNIKGTVRYLLTPRAKSILKDSFSIASMMSHKIVGNVHLIMAILMS